MEEQQREENGEVVVRHTRSTDDQLITDLDKEVLEESDIIMTFLNKSESPIMIDRSCASSMAIH